MELKVTCEITLEFNPNLQKTDIDDRVGDFIDDFNYYDEKLENPELLTPEQIEEFTKEKNLIGESLRMENIQGLYNEITKKSLKNRFKEHLENYYKQILHAILKNSQIDNYFDTEYEPTLKFGNTVKFQMKFSENLLKNLTENSQQNFITETINEGLEITHMNISDTLLKWESDLFIINSKFSPIFEIGYIDFDPEKVKIKF